MDYHVPHVPQVSSIQVPVRMPKLVKFVKGIGYSLFNGYVGTTRDIDDATLNKCRT